MPLNSMQQLVADEARRQGQDPAEALGLVDVESGFNSEAVSPRGAVGLGQLMPVTGAAYGVPPESRIDPERNIRAALRYYGDMLTAAGGNRDLALRYYNAGITGTQQGRSDPRYVHMVRQRTAAWRQAMAGENQGQGPSAAEFWGDEPGQTTAPAPSAPSAEEFWREPTAGAAAGAPPAAAPMEAQKPLASLTRPLSDSELDAAAQNLMGVQGMEFLAAATPEQRRAYLRAMPGVIKAVIPPASEMGAQYVGGRVAGAPGAAIAGEGMYKFNQYTGMRPGDPWSWGAQDWWNVTAPLVGYGPSTLRNYFMRQVEQTQPAKAIQYAHDILDATRTGRPVPPAPAPGTPGLPPDPASMRTLWEGIKWNSPLEALAAWNYPRETLATLGVAAVPLTLNALRRQAGQWLLRPENADTLSSLLRTARETPIWAKIGAAVAPQAYQTTQPQP